MRTETLLKFLSGGTAESSSRLIGYRGAMVQLVVLCGLCAVICYQGMTFHAIDNGLLVAFTTVSGIVAVLVREISKLKSVEAAASPACGPGDVSELPQPTGAKDPEA